MQNQYHFQEMNILKEIDMLSNSESIEIKQIIGGYVNKTYLISVIDNGQINANYILRICQLNTQNSETIQFETTHSIQYTITNFSGLYGIGPKVLFTNEDNTKMLMEYIDGSELTSQIFSKIILENIMKSLKKFHQVPEFYQTCRHYNTFDHIKEMLKYVAHGAVSDRDMEAINKIEICVSHGNEKYMKFCHNDLHKGNILVRKDSSVSIIDYDYCGIFDVMYDIATIYHSLELDCQDESINQFIVEYFGYTDDKLLERFKLFSIVYHFWNAVWFLSRVANNDSFYNFGMKSLVKFRELLHFVYTTM